ncbi:hypothetical protein [Nodosilinea sp. E11]|uniref:hypothetical protein n=1 Tax=Nodosilinea sp. E11 TaxID=3037479 RepID=UPI0029341112|nr:hypothetical protein [Nodosilinea sp. E11]WOD40084.1 hypothetical protein RRF56_04690 [Nodosilinea sp. E11]
MARAIGLKLLIIGLVLATGVACDRQSLTGDPPPSAPLNAPGPPPPPDGAFLAQMAPDQTSQLTSLGVDVVVPGEVPPAFAIVEMRIDQGDPGPAYLVVYQNDLNQCFAVEFAADGIGDPLPTENRLPLQPPLFGDQGYGLNYGPFAEADMQSQFPEPNLFTDWMLGPSGAYRLIGATYIGDLFESLGNCEDVSPEVAVALAESFTVLSADPMGAD